MHFKTLVAMASATFALVACGGGGSVGLGGGAGAGATATPVPGGTGSPTAVPTGSAGYNITGTVDGTVRNGTVNVSGSWLDGNASGSGLTASTGGAQPIVWSIQQIKPVVGPYTCNTGGNLLVISLTDSTVVNPMDPLTAQNVQVMTGFAGGACSLTVTAVSATEIEGTFSATLKNATQTFTRTVVNGSFKVARTPPT